MCFVFGKYFILQLGYNVIALSFDPVEFSGDCILSTYVLLCYLTLITLHMQKEKTKKVKFGGVKMRVSEIS